MMDPDEEIIKTNAIALSCNEVSGILIDKIFHKDQTIADCFLDLDVMLPIIKKIELYYRDDYGICNWMIDLTLNDGNLYYVKITPEVSEVEVHRFCKPLFDKFIEYISSDNKGTQK